MPTTRRIQKIGNSRGLILTSEMMDHLGVLEQVSVTFETGRIVLTAPAPEARLVPGRRRQSRAEAVEATLAQYGEALQRLAGPPGKERAAGSDEAEPPV